MVPMKRSMLFGTRVCVHSPCRVVLLCSQSGALPELHSALTFLYLSVELTVDRHTITQGAAGGGGEGWYSMLLLLCWLLLCCCCCVLFRSVLFCWSSPLLSSPSVSRLPFLPLRQRETNEESHTKERRSNKQQTNNNKQQHNTIQITLYVCASFLCGVAWWRCVCVPCALCVCVGMCRFGYTATDTKPTTAMESDQRKDSEENTHKQAGRGREKGEQAHAQEASRSPPSAVLSLCAVASLLWLL